MALFELLQLLGIFFDYLGVEYLWHASIMPSTKRNGITRSTMCLIPRNHPHQTAAREGHARVRLHSASGYAPTLQGPRRSVMSDGGGRDKYPFLSCFHSCGYEVRVGAAARTGNHPDELRRSPILGSSRSISCMCIGIEPSGPRLDSCSTSD